MIERKLLCAAGQCYAIAQDGPVGHWTPRNPRGLQPEPARCGDVGWIGPVQGVTAGTREDDAGMVGRIDEGVIIALRGTVPTFTDWFNNFEFQLSPSSTGDFPGMTHKGFRDAAVAVLRELAPAIVAAVSDADATRPDGSPAPIYVTGHSKGGAMAPFVAWWLRTCRPAPIAKRDRRVVVRTFAAPALANPTFCLAYEAMGIDHIRYECHGDLVPLLPLTGDLVRNLPPLIRLPSDGGYAPLGELRYISEDGAFEAVTSVEAARTRALIDICVGLATDRLPIDQHEVFRGSGYCRAPYP